MCNIVINLMGDILVDRPLNVYLRRCRDQTRASKLLATVAAVPVTDRCQLHCQKREKKNNLNIFHLEIDVEDKMPNVCSTLYRRRKKVLIEQAQLAFGYDLNLQN